MHKIALEFTVLMNDSQNSLTGLTDLIPFVLGNPNIDNPNTNCSHGLSNGIEGDIIIW